MSFYVGYQYYNVVVPKDLADPFWHYKNKARLNKAINITVSQVCAQAVLLKELSCLANFEYHAAWLDIVTFGLANTTSF